MKRNSRKQERTECKGLVKISWETAGGETRYAMATLLDISRNGMGIQLSEEIPVRSFVTMRSEALKVAGTGVSRYCVRRGSKYNVGLQFGNAIGLDPSHRQVAVAATAD